MLLSIIEIIAVILPVLLGIAYLTLAERKVMGSSYNKKIYLIKIPIIKTIFINTFSTKIHKNKIFFIHSRSYSNKSNNERKISSLVHRDEPSCIESEQFKNNSFTLYNIDLPSNLMINSIKIFIDACKYKTNITKDYKNVCGIYLWFNRINKKIYIGSGYNLSRRLTEYYFLSKLTRINKFNQLSPINAAILKYGHNNFSLVILEICGDTKSIEKNYYLKREQYFIDLIKPEYNILSNTNSSVGFKHLEETKNKIRKSLLGYKHTEDTKLRMSQARINFKLCSACEQEMSKNRGTPIYIFNSKSLYLINIFNSSNKAALYFNCSDTTIMKYARNNKIFKEKWIFSLKKVL